MHESGAVELYDLSTDRAEQNNLAGKYRRIAEKIGRLMDQAWTKPRSQKDDGVYRGFEADPKRGRKWQIISCRQGGQIYWPFQCSDPPTCHLPPATCHFPLVAGN